MKPGDLVRMKYNMWWRLQDRKEFTQEHGIVLSVDYNAVKVMLTSGRKKCSLINEWEVINES